MSPKRSRRKLFMILLLLTAMVTAAVAYAFPFRNRLPDFAYRYVDERQHETNQLKLTSPGSWTELQDGLDLRKVAFKREKRLFSSFRLVVLRVEPEKFDLRMVYVPLQDLPVTNVDVLAEKTGSIALMNASYFEPDYKVMGLLIADGKTVSPLRKGGSLHHGVWMIQRGKAFIQHRTEINLTDVTQAFQAGPWLVTDGEAQPRENDSGFVTRRSAVGVDRKGRVYLMVTDTLLGGFSLKELAEFLVRAEEQGGLELWRAINCDGGKSTQMLLRHEKSELNIYSSVNVPVYLGVYATHQ